MIERQQIDHRPKTQLLGPLRDGRQKDSRRWRIAEGRVVVLGQVIAVEPGAIVGLDELQPLLKMPGQRFPAVVQMVEDPKTHLPPPYVAHAAASIASAIFSAVIRVGKFVLAQGTVGNGEASTTRSPSTPRTRP